MNLFYKIWKTDETAAFTEIAGGGITGLSSISHRLEEEATVFSYESITFEGFGFAITDLRAEDEYDKFIIEIRNGLSWDDPLAKWVFTGVIDNEATSYDHKTGFVNGTARSALSLIEDNSKFPIRTIATARLLDARISQESIINWGGYEYKQLKVENFLGASSILKIGATIVASGKHDAIEDEFEVRMIITSDFYQDSDSNWIGQVMIPKAGFAATRGPYTAAPSNTNIKVFNIPYTYEIEEFIKSLYSKRPSRSPSSVSYLIGDDLWVGLGEGNYGINSPESQIYWTRVVSVDIVNYGRIGGIIIVIEVVDEPPAGWLAGPTRDVFLLSKDWSINTGGDIKILDRDVIGITPDHSYWLRPEFDCDDLVSALLNEGALLKKFFNFGANVEEFGYSSRIPLYVDFPNDRKDFLAGIQRSGEFFVKISGIDGTEIEVGGPTQLKATLYTRGHLASQPATQISVPIEYTESVSQTKPKFVLVRGHGPIIDSKFGETSVGWWPHESFDRIVPFEANGVINIESPFIIPVGTGKRGKVGDKTYRRDDRLSAFAKRYYLFYSQFWREAQVRIDGLYFDALGRVYSELHTSTSFFIVGVQLDYIKKETVLDVRVGDWIAPVNEAPVVILDGDTLLIGVTGTPVYGKASFDATRSYDPNGDRISFTWYHNGNLIANATGPYLYNFNVEDADTIKVRVTDDGGLFSESQLVMKVIDFANIGTKWFVGGAVYLAVTLIDNTSSVTQTYKIQCGKDGTNVYVEYEILLGGVVDAQLSFGPEEDYIEDTVIVPRPTGPSYFNKLRVRGLNYLDKTATDWIEIVIDSLIETGGAQNPIPGAVSDKTTAIYLHQDPENEVINDQDVFQELFDNYDGYFDFNEHIDFRIEYTFEGLEMDWVSGNAYPGIILPREVFTDPLVFLCFFDAVSNARYISNQILNAWWDYNTDEKYTLIFQVSEPYNGLDQRRITLNFYRIQYVPSYSWTYAIQFKENLTVSMDNGAFVGFALDRANSNWKVFWCDKVSGWQERSGTWNIWQAPTGYPQDDVYGDPVLQMHRLGYWGGSGPQGTEFKGLYAQFDHDYKGDDRIKTIYQTIRNYLGTRNISYLDELPDISTGRAILTSEVFDTNDTTPDVSGGSGIFYTNNTIATSITFFDGGVENQQIYVYIADINTTIVYNGSFLITKSGSNITAGGVYSFLLLNGKWREV